MDREEIPPLAAEHLRRIDMRVHDDRLFVNACGTRALCRERGSGSADRDETKKPFHEASFFPDCTVASATATTAIIGAHEKSSVEYPSRSYRNPPSAGPPSSP